MTLGRSGGGGGRSGGGSFGGSRSSGGRSFGGGRSGGSSFGGGFSRRSSSSGSSGGSPRGSWFGGLPGGGSFGSGGSTGGGGFSGGGSGASGCGCGTVVIFIVFIFLIFLILQFFLSAPNSDSGLSTSSADITTSSIERVPLPQGAVNETDYYTDELGWINNSTELETGMKHFYQQTGVQPYLYITDNVNGSRDPSDEELDAYARGLYDQLFTDEAHLLLVFYEYNEQYMDRYVCGTQAKTVIDDEAANILLDYVDRYYYEDSMTDDEFFSAVFRDSADRIMKVNRSPWPMVLLVLGILLLLVLGFVWWRQVKKQREIEDKRTEELLSTPLEKYGETAVEDVSQKYEGPVPQAEDLAKKYEDPDQ